ncbi:hypothetical protein T03_4353 [Trichinella britovi]|uniref:Uncharacterized protein n=1 Tax=Trichinella britovi TaxID=45882 RepID=A0A0V1AJE9_TRIBR|nr:hypothetical protein T03_4353 [Trichinella britovi]
MTQKQLLEKEVKEPQQAKMTEISLLRTQGDDGVISNIPTSRRHPNYFRTSSHTARCQCLSEHVGCIICTWYLPHFYFAFLYLFFHEMVPYLDVPCPC